MLGTRNVNNLITFFELKKGFDKKSSISHEKYWDLAMDTATVMKLLINSLGTKINCALDDAYAFGLFRDCGIPLMGIKYDNYKSVLIAANQQTEMMFTQVEDHQYHTNHAVVGYFVARSWNLPQNLCELILRHHEPDFLQSGDADKEQKDLYALAKVAENILSHYKDGKDDTEWHLVKDDVLSYLGLSDMDYHEIHEDTKETLMIEL